MCSERVLGFMGPQAQLWMFLILSCFIGSGYAYTPAQPSNSTRVSSSGAADSTLDLWWWPRGTLTEPVSYQMAANDSTGTTAGPLLQFQEEEKMSNDTTTTPWIALISCDKKNNNTEYLPDVDIFTLAWQRGAVAALLYSNSSQTCVIDEAYLNETAYARLIDVFTVEALDVTHIIHDDYALLQNMTHYVNFNATLLNDTQALVNQSLEQSSASRPGFLYARLESFNTTVSPNSTSGSSDGGNPPGRNSTGNTGLAMIVLYSITGVVSALFCIVIVTGVIRAIRHPERYTRSDAFGVGGMAAPPRRRTVITRAILDTFPVIKFNRGTASGAATEDAMDAGHKDIELGEVEYGKGSGVGLGEDANEMNRRGVGVGGDEREGTEEIDGPTPLWLAPLVHRSEDELDLNLDMDVHRSDLVEDEDLQVDGRAASGSNNSHPSSPRVQHRQRVASGSGSPARAQESGSPPAAGPPTPLMPDAIGHATCPICIVDFEEGDDLRVLPCEGKHCFHQQCVDPWLLELSGSCPLCRQDFARLETMMEGTPGNPELYRVSAAPSVSAHHQGPPRLSHYIRFAQRRRNSNRNHDRHHRDGDDPSGPAFEPTGETEAEAEAGAPSLPPIPRFSPSPSPSDPNV